MPQLSDRYQTARRLGAILLCLALFALAPTALADTWAPQRQAMVRTLEAHAASLPPSAGIDGISPRVLAVMESVPRHRFVPEAVRGQAYADRPLRIGYGQTISQPFIVALMTELLQLDEGARVLEIGTGSGYQAAVLSPLAERVCTIEIVPGLARTATPRLAELGYANVETRIGDGYHGWEDCGPFDGIVVTAAAGHVPPPLVRQLKPGGRMVIPVGGPYGTQYLTLIEKRADGGVSTRQLLPVRFVPFTRAAD